jgi:hypothetical protein
LISLLTDCFTSDWPPVRLGDLFWLQLASHAPPLSLQILYQCYTLQLHLLWSVRLSLTPGWLVGVIDEHHRWLMRTPRQSQATPFSDSNDLLRQFELLCHCDSLYCNSFTLSGIESTAACFAQFCTIFSMFICCDWFTCSLDLLWLILHGIRAIAGTRSPFYRCLYKKIWLNCSKIAESLHEISQGHSLLCMQSLKNTPIPLQKLELPHKSWIWYIGPIQHCLKSNPRCDELSKGGLFDLIVIVLMWFAG